MERSQYLFIHSALCPGEPYDFTYTLPPGLVRCDPASETLHVSLVKWTTRLDWYAIREPHNDFSIVYEGTTRSYVIPPGNYTYALFAATISSLLNADKAALGVTSGDIVVAFSSLTCKLSIVFPNAVADRTLVVPAYKRHAWGLSGTSATTVGAMIQSDIPMNFWKHEERLLIRCEGLHPKGGRSLAHVGSAVTDAGSTLASVLVNALPFETVVYEDDGNAFGHGVHERHLQGSLHFKVTELDGTPADYVGENHIVLKVSAVANHRATAEAQLRSLKSTEEYLRMMFVGAHLAGDGGGTESQQADRPDLPGVAA